MDEPMLVFKPPIPTYVCNHDGTTSNVKGSRNCGHYDSDTARQNLLSKLWGQSNFSWITYMLSEPVH